MRVQQREYWNAFEAAAHREREDLLLVAIAPSVATSLRTQLYSPARIRGGLLFGQQQGETLHIVLATTLGRSSWYTSARQTALTVDARFALGWSEALHGVLGSATDWMGNWIMYDDSQLHNQRKDRQRFKAGQALGLFDESHILLIPGWEDGRFSCRAYRQDVDGKAEALALNFEGQDVVEKIRTHLGSGIGVDDNS